MSGKLLDVLVCAGGGGVGKTTTSAALALALARQGRRAVIVSIDPARRLADALGVELGTDAKSVAVDTGTGELFGLMPDPRRAMRTFVEILFEGQPDALERLLHNRLYKVLEDAVPGIHELVAMSLTWRAVRDQGVDTVIIDTAPSRNAVDFVTYPGRLAKLLGGRAVGWLAKMASKPPDEASKMGRAEKLLVRAIGPVVSDVAGLFAEMARVRDRFVYLNEQTSGLLLGDATRYLLVAAPTGASEEDVDFLVARLKKLDVAPKAIIVNSSYTPEPVWMQVLAHSTATTPAMHEALEAIHLEQQARARAAERTLSTLARRHGRVPRMQLPFVEAAQPREVVEALSRELDLPGILGRPVG